MMMTSNPLSADPNEWGIDWSGPIFTRGGTKVNGDPFMTDTRSGPNAFASVSLFNQGLWRSRPERAQEAMLDAVASGGFDGDCIRRKVGNYEGQIMAIRAGWVDGKPYDWRRPEEADVVDAWHLNEKGGKALRAAGRPVPTFFTARDDWHSRGTHESVFEYGVYELERNGQPMLKLFAKAYPRYSVGMDPLLRRNDVLALRDYLNDWLARTRDA